MYIILLHELQLGTAAFGKVCGGWVEGKPVCRVIEPAQRLRYSKVKGHTGKDEG
jgi:hypothetical protein